MKNHIKTYELFGFGKKKGIIKSILPKKKLSKNIKDFLSSEKEKETNIRGKRDKLSKVISNIGHMIENTYPGITTVNIENEKINITISPPNSWAKTIMEVRDITINMRFSIESSYSHYQENTYELTHNQYADNIQCELKKIKDSKGNLSERWSDWNSDTDFHNRRMMRRRLVSGNSVIFRFDLSDNIDDIKSKNYKVITEIEESVSKIIGRLKDYENSLIRYYIEQDKLKWLHEIDADTLKDIFGDLIDISDDYTLNKMKDYYSASFNIKGVGISNKKDDDKTFIKINKIKSQVLRLLSEIEGRLGEMGLETSINFEPNKVNMIISKLDNSEVVVTTKRRPIRRAPR